VLFSAVQQCEPAITSHISPPSWASLPSPNLLTHIYGIQNNGIDEPYLQGRNGDTGVEHGLVDTLGEGVNGMNGESCINIYTLSCVKRIVGEKLQLNILNELLMTEHGWYEKVTLWGLPAKKKNICLLLQSFFSKPTRHLQGRLQMKLLRDGWAVTGETLLISTCPIHPME